MKTTPTYPALLTLALILFALLSFAFPEIPGDPRFSEALRAEERQVAGATPSRGIPGEGYAGIWQGSLKSGPMQLRLLFKLSGPDDDTPSTLDSLDQNANNLPIHSVAFDQGTLKIELSKPKARFEGVMSEDGSEVVGHWIQGGGKLPLAIKRLEKQPDLARWQNPVKPYPYGEEEVTFENASAGIQLSGTLTTPFSAPPHPAVVLISGSGPQDRDEALMGHRPFLVLADRLTRAGIAVLRYDDRGYGKSTGSFSSATTSDFKNDALAAIKYLRTLPRIDSEKLGLVGHSEGGLVAPQVAANNPDIAFIVLLSAPGVPMDQLLARQSQDMIRISGGSEEVLALQSQLQGRIFAAIKSVAGDSDLESRIRPKVRDVFDSHDAASLEALGIDEGQVDTQINRVATPWFRELLSIDPRVALSQVHCPVLALNGAKDMQVAADVNLRSIEEALLEGGNRRTTAIEMPKLNHLFQACETGSIAEYGSIEETFNESALSAIEDWILEVTR